MASQEETMRLTAQVVDKFSAPIRDMQRAFRGMGEHGRAAHIEGTRYAKAHMRMHSKICAKVPARLRTISKTFSGRAWSRLGLSAVSTGAAIAGITKSIKDFAGPSREMNFLKTETAGLSTPIYCVPPLVACGVLPDWVHVGCSNIAAAILHHGHNPRRRVTIECKTRVGVPFGICLSLIDPAIGWLPFGSDWVVNPAYGGEVPPSSLDLIGNTTAILDITRSIEGIDKRITSSKPLKDAQTRTLRWFDARGLGTCSPASSNR